MPHALPVKMDGWVNATGRVGLSPTPTNPLNDPKLQMEEVVFCPSQVGNASWQTKGQHSRARRLLQPSPFPACALLSRLDGQETSCKSNHPQMRRGYGCQHFSNHCPMPQPFFVKQIHTALSSPDFHTYYLFKTHRPTHGEHTFFTQACSSLLAETSSLPLFLTHQLGLCQVWPPILQAFLAPHLPPPLSSGWLSCLLGVPAPQATGRQSRGLPHWGPHSLNQILY